MNKFYFLLISGLLGATSYATPKEIVLDLSHSVTGLEFDTTTGAWTGTFDDDEECIESQVFLFQHRSISDWSTWWGFTASKSADNSMRNDYITYQYSNMASGGIQLNEDGTVKLNEYGAPVVSPEMPYLVAYYSQYMSQRPVDMIFNDGKSYEAVGMYVNLSSYTYYTVCDGDGFARAFTNGDSLTLTVHGVSPTGEETTVDVKVASCDNGNLTTSRGWSYVDLTPLGLVDEIYFTMTSTDTGAYGPNTPLYFCLDKLTVRESDMSNIESIKPAGGDCNITYDRMTKTVRVDGPGYAAVYDVNGRKVIASESSEFSIEELEHGIYVVRTGASSLKIAR